MPSRDELTLAWGDVILPGLPGRVRAYVQLGRFLPSGPDTAVYALPDPGLLARAEPIRADVESALAGHFGRRVPLRLVLDDNASPPAPEREGLEPEDRPAGSREERDDPEDAENPDDYVLAEMEDATGVMSPEQRLLQAFPGAEEVTP